MDFPPSYSLILGRPFSIQESYFDVQEPANADWEDYSTDRPVVSKPLTQPTSATFMLLRNRFAHITGRIAHHFQKLNQLATYSEVEKLDEEILSFVEDLPRVSEAVYRRVPEGIVVLT